MSLLSWEGALPQETTEAYHLRYEMSSTQIKRAGKTGLHYKKFVLEGIKQQDSPSIDIGSLAHEFVHENKFTDVIKMPDFAPIETTVPGVRNGTFKKHTVTIKSQKNDFLLANPGKRIISIKEHELISGMRESFFADSLVQKYIQKDDKIEQGYLYFDAKNKVNCRFRPDRLNFASRHVIDYKTTTNASAEAFKWAVLKYGYHVSAAHYMIGLERLFPETFKEFIFIVQETAFPFACAVYKLQDIDLIFGMSIRDEYLRKIRRWEKNNYFPGYTEKLTDLHLPDYSYQSMGEPDAS